MSAPSSTGIPRYVNIAYWLFLLVALLHVVLLIVGVLMLNTSGVKSQLNNQGVSSSTANATLGAGIAFVVVIQVLFIAAFVLIDVFMRRGANWARIVLLVLTILSLTGVAGAYGLGALSVAAAVVATILMFLRPSSEYFRAVKASKMGGQAPLPPQA